MPEVSVIIPFHNRIDWLAEAVQSVLDQTYEDFEIILVDDGSNEQIPPDLVRDSRIRYARQEHKGASAARNYGLSLARGKYIAFLDSDDLFFPTKLAKQVAYMEKHPEVQLSHTSYQRLSREGKDLEIIHSSRFSGRISRKSIFGCIIATPTVMLRREAIGDLRFEESLRVAEDICFWLRCGIRSRIVGLPEPLSKVRMHGENATFDEEAQLAAKMNVIKYVIERNPEFTTAVSGRVRSSIYQGVALFYLSRGDMTNYTSYLDQAGAAWPISRRIRCSIYLEVARFYLSRGDMPNYTRYLKQAVAAWPINPRIHGLLVKHVIGKLVYEIKKAAASTKA